MDVVLPRGDICGPGGCEPPDAWNLRTNPDLPLLERLAKTEDCLRQQVSRRGVAGKPVIPPKLPPVWTRGKRNRDAGWQLARSAFFRRVRRKKKDLGLRVNVCGRHVNRLWSELEADYFPAAPPVQFPFGRGSVYHIFFAISCG